MPKVKVEDLLDDLEGNEEDKPLTEEDIKSLQEELALLKKEKHGLLQDVKGERKKRQSMSSRVETLEGTLNGILDVRTNATDVADSIGTPEAITLEFNDDGDALLPQAALDAMLKPYKEEIESLKGTLTATQQMQQANANAEQVMNSIVGEDPAYSGVFSKYQSARKWVNDRVVDYQIENNYEGTMNSGEALDNVFDNDTEADFNTNFPGMSLTDVVTAEDSQRHFRTMLNNAVSSANPQNDNATQNDSRFKAVLNKPSGLGDTKNARAGHVPISEKMSGLSTEDILNLSDAQVEQITKALLNEELTDGVKF